RLSIWELDGAVRDPIYPDGYFPRTYVDITPRDLLRDFQKHAPGKLEVRSDELRIVRSAPEKSGWFRQLRDLLPR
ncbi:MAG: hypothetical protein AAF585_18890, partial [Verrucomicrobiota bacterium]